jgi:hypothetical protein
MKVVIASLIVITGFHFPWNTTVKRIEMRFDQLMEIKQPIRGLIASERNEINYCAVGVKTRESIMI